ncbi:hypothetical protein NC652_010799 [Populus alba x Populus x berolinensis]|nr:hypothetical protein NC652_010799 [Populus alba x Populus x berolinensis]
MLFFSCILFLATFWLALSIYLLIPKKKHVHNVTKYKFKYTFQHLKKTNKKRTLKHSWKISWEKLVCGRRSNQRETAGGGLSLWVLWSGEASFGFVEWRSWETVAVVG